MKKLLYPILLILLFPLGVNAQKKYTGSVAFEGAKVEKRNDQIFLEATLNVNSVDLGKQQMMMVTPVLRALDRANELTFDPVLIMGNVRRKAVARATVLNSYYIDAQPSRTIIYRRNNIEPVHFNLQAPYEAWMRNAELVFIEEVKGCRNMELSNNQHRILSPVLPPVYRPTYQISYAEPPTEEVKQRSESYEARINFRVNRYEIVHDYMNNATVLNEVDRIISEVKNDQNLTITAFNVTGYASPEGAAAHNMTLSENRAKSFVTYVQNKHAIPQSAMQVDWKGDDWDGLRKQMQESSFSDKQRVLDILNDTTDPQQRKNQLRNMGTAYQTLLNDYYPYLRRNEYTISYVARPFSVQEAKELVTTKPQQLSLNEMFLVANTYPKNSPQFKEVFDIAVRMYPDSQYANLNSAALDIENGAYDVALERSMKVNMPEAWNNIGYIYIQKGDYARAAEYFKRAADAGLSIGRTNLQELNRWMQDPE